MSEFTLATFADETIAARCLAGLQLHMVTRSNVTFSLIEVFTTWVLSVTTSARYDYIDDEDVRSARTFVAGFNYALR